MDIKAIDILAVVPLPCKLTGPSLDLFPVFSYLVPGLQSKKQRSKWSKSKSRHHGEYSRAVSITVTAAAAAVRDRRQNGRYQISYRREWTERACRLCGYV